MGENGQVKPTAQPIYDELKKQILSGERAPGEPLRQDEIARQYGVSKIPVREALMKLEVDGFVLIRKNKGATVREVSATEILNIMDIRVALECKALELSIPNMIASDIELAGTILDDYSKHSDPEQWSDMNLRFHHALYEPCSNPLLLRMISDLQQRIGPQLRLLVTTVTGLERPQAEHAAILEACRVGDGGKAVELLRKHIETTKKETAAKLRRIDKRI
ncbi:GntR family transcriptional regulator [Ruegeria atlantica]|uniref:GntR family transcriptional regulator n=1 Tax=Ruegeria atlantica TaxID=81569 RepID=UPI0014816997|nr:GntR family transcriptional regulator [Ruegeria atlantica]